MSAVMERYAPTERSVKDVLHEATNSLVRAKNAIRETIQAKVATPKKPARSASRKTRTSKPATKSAASAA